jgi:hypothetical protein
LHTIQDDMKDIKGTMLPLLLLVLFPSASYAEAGELGGIAMFAFNAFLVLWVGLTLLLLVLLRKLSWGKRLGWGALFLFSPVLLLALALLKAYAFGESTDEVTELTRQPLTVYGATFPPGSRASYDQSGGFFGWHAERTLLEIHGPGPVLMGKLHIDGFIFIQNNSGNEVRVELSPGEAIDGWPCGDTTVDLEPNGPVFQSCFLATPYSWHGRLLSAGVFVTTSGPSE